MIVEVANIAAECLKTPTKQSIWSPRLRRYVCPDTPEGHEALADQTLLMRAGHAPISPQFKLVFVTAFSGTILFVALCVLLSFLAGREPAPLFEKVVMAFFDLAKIGFGAIVGLLGGKKIQDSSATN